MTAKNKEYHTDSLVKNGMHVSIKSIVCKEFLPVMQLTTLLLQ